MGILAILLICYFISTWIIFRHSVNPDVYKRQEWAKVCNEHLPLHNQVDHRSYEKQGKLQIPTIHEGADARKIEQKFLAGQEIKGSWKVAENQIIKQQNTLLQKILAASVCTFPLMVLPPKSYLTTE